MANNYGYQFTLTKEPGVVKLFGLVTIAAAGAVTLNAPKSKGIASVTKLATAGQYSIKLQETYYQFLMMDSLVQNATGIPAAPDMGIISEAVATYGNQAIVVQFSSAGVATNPAAGDTVYFEISLKNVSVK